MKIFFLHYAIDIYDYNISKALYFVGNIILKSYFQVQKKSFLPEKKFQYLV